MSHGKISAYVYLLTELGILTVNKYDFIVIKSLIATVQPSIIHEYKSHATDQLD